MNATMSSPDSLEAIILDGLPPRTKQYAYTGLDDCRSTISTNTAHLEACDCDCCHRCSQFLLFTSLDEHTYTTDFQHPSSKTLAHAIDSYYPESGLLVVKMTTKAHEEAYHVFNEVLLGKLMRMAHAEHGLHKTGTAEIRTPSRAKKADQGYQPKRLPLGRSSKWPSVVIESGCTDSRTTLQRNAQWWLSDSEGDVKGVVTICIQKKRKREVLFDFWAAPDRRTKSNAAAISTARQSVTLSRDDANAETRVVGAPFIIPFESLFLRPPVTPELDVEFGQEDLGYIAESVWELQAVV